MSDTKTLIENRPPSVATLFIERVAATPDAEAYRHPVPPATGQGPDDWKSLSWGQAAVRVYAMAAGLIALGVRPEERVALAAATRVEWILADLGVMCAGAATTTVYPSTNAEECAYILADSDSRILIAEDAEQLAKARERRSELPKLAHVVVIDEAARRRPRVTWTGGCSPSPSWRSAGRSIWRSTPRQSRSGSARSPPSSSPPSSTPRAPPAVPRAYGWRTTTGRTWRRPSRAPGSSPTTTSSTSGCRWRTSSARC